MCFKVYSDKMTNNSTTQDIEFRLKSCDVVYFTPRGTCVVSSPLNTAKARRTLGEFHFTDSRVYVKKKSKYKINSVFPVTKKKRVYVSTTSVLEF